MKIERPISATNNSKYIDFNQSKESKKVIKKVFMGFVIVVTLFSGCTQMNSSFVPVINENEPSIEQQTPKPTPKKTVPPAVSSSPTPKPTSVMTEDEKYVKIHNAALESDIYAYFKMVDLYKKGKLENLIKSGQISKEDMELAVEQSEWIAKESYFIEKDLFLYDCTSEGMYGFEIVMRIARGDDLTYSEEQLELAIKNVEDLIRNHNGYLTAFPEESRGKIKEVVDMFEDIDNPETLKKYDEVMKSDYLNPLEKSYVLYTCVYAGTEEQFFQSVTVVYEEQKTTFAEYVFSSNLKSLVDEELKDYFFENYLTKDLVKSGM